MNPYKEISTQMTSVDFEKYCFEILLSYGREEQLKDFVITYDEKLKSHDGTYQIDKHAEFTALNVKIKVIAECKRYSSKIKREKIVIFANKMKSLGVQKGIFMSTSGYQSGAVLYAKEHGITLLRIFDKHVMHIQNAASKKPKEFHDMELEFIKRMPKYYAYKMDEEQFPLERVYPNNEATKLMKQEILNSYKEKKTKRK